MLEGCAQCPWYEEDSISDTSLETQSRLPRGGNIWDETVDEKVCYVDKLKRACQMHRFSCSIVQKSTNMLQITIKSLPLLLFSHWVMPTLCDPMDCSPPNSSVHGILQVKILEWLAISFSRGSSYLRDRTCISCTSRQILHSWPTRKAP